MRTLVLANQKGGVGKSFVATQLSFFLADRGARVLHLDLDHQGNSSQPLVRSGRAQVASFYASELLSGAVADLPDGGLVVVAGDTALSTLERQPERHNGYVNRLSEFLDDIAARFDVCIIDTNPNPDIRYAAALIVADFVVSPVQLNQEAIEGIGALLDHPRYGFDKIKAVLNPHLELIGILPNLVEATPFQRSNFAALAARHSNLLIRSTGMALGFAFIPTRTAIAEAQAAAVPVWLLRQALPANQQGVADPLSMPVRTSARDTWREIRPVFEEIERRLGLGGVHGV
jgi:chromosome partitioning protein